MVGVNLEATCRAAALAKAACGAYTYICFKLYDSWFIVYAV
jgi:hypothetical protein